MPTKSGDEVDIERLLAEAISRRANHVCWATKGPAKNREAFEKYLEGIEAMDLADGSIVNRSQVSRTLLDVFGIKVSRESVRRHLQGECRCEE